MAAQENQRDTNTSSNRGFRDGPLFAHERVQGRERRLSLLLGSPFRIQLTLFDAGPFSGCGYVHPRSPPL
jgi:hypothetical protein